MISFEVALVKSGFGLALTVSGLLWFQAGAMLTDKGSIHTPEAAADSVSSILSPSITAHPSLHMRISLLLAFPFSPGEQREHHIKIALSNSLFSFSQHSVYISVTRTFSETPKHIKKCDIAQTCCKRAWFTNT